MATQIEPCSGEIMVDCPARRSESNPSPVSDRRPAGRLRGLTLALSLALCSSCSPKPAPVPPSGEDGHAGPSAADDAGKPQAAAGESADPDASGASAALTIALRAFDPPTVGESGQPSLTVAPDGAFLLSWLEEVGERETALRYARRTIGAPAWSEPMTVAEGPDWFVNWADVPGVVAGPNHLAAHWLVRSADGPGGYDAWVSRADAEGQGWTEPRRLHDDTQVAEHGFVSLLPRADGSTLALWLDGRAYAADTPEMSLRSRILVRDGSLGPEAIVDEKTCDCCPTALAATAGAGALAVWRDRTGSEIRDIASSRFAAGAWSSPVAVAADGWVMPGCPVNGPALAVRRDRVVVAWFTAEGERPRVQVAFSFDGGATFTSAFPVADGSPLGRVDVALLADGSALVSWLDAGDGPHEAGLRLRRVARDGRREATVVAASAAGSRATGMPQLAVSGGEVLLAWTEPGEPSRVRVGEVALTELP